MLMQRWRPASTHLARSRVVLARGSPRRRWAGAGAALLAALLAGAAASHAWRHHDTDTWQPHAALQASAASATNGTNGTTATNGTSGTSGTSGLLPLEQNLTTARLQLRVAQARSLELENQIDTLHQGLHACQEEVAFFRKAVNAKR